MIKRPPRTPDKSDLPTTVPLFPLTGAILLPQGQLPLNIFEPRYLNLVDDALRTNRLIGMIQPRQSGGEQAAAPALFDVGGLGRLTAFSETDDGRYLITLTGLTRFKILREITAVTPYRQADVSYDPFGDDLQSEDDTDFDRAPLLLALKRYFTVFQIQSNWQAIKEAPAEGLINSLSMISPVGGPEKQALLEAPSFKDRARILITLIELALAERTEPGGGERPN